MLLKTFDHNSGRQVENNIIGDRYNDIKAKSRNQWIKREDTAETRSSCDDVLTKDPGLQETLSKTMKGSQSTAVAVTNLHGNTRASNCLERPSNVYNSSIRCPLLSSTIVKRCFLQ